ncbi:gamma-glutamyl-gamma-aminobutyrate hydrolase family protein [Streptomyces sp. NPDC059650]|uniref:gamma-glutamyl-gamma-aminobutyrate hydrolase family protein n=1 Tax=Streptomyces sp. NPDC059650 TaxID=3346896 RepID=UPI0036BF56F4
MRERDAWEQAVLAAGLARDIPVLGVCRGMQLVNVHAGGTLVHDLPDRVGHHPTQVPSHPATHPAAAEPEPVRQLRVVPFPGA